MNPLITRFYQNTKMGEEDDGCNKLGIELSTTAL